MSDLLGLVEAYRKASQAELRARGRTGKRADSQRLTASNARRALRISLEDAGHRDLADALIREHEAACTVHGYLIGEGYEPLTIDYPLSKLKAAREEIASLLATPAPDGTVTG